MPVSTRRQCPRKVKHTVKTRKLFAAAGVLGAAALVLAGCSSSSTTSTSSSAAASSSASVDYSSLEGTITAGGSSAQGAAQAAWIAAFQSKASGVTVNYDKSQGSGGGVTNWLNKSYDFAGSDAALKTDQIATAKSTYGADALNLPVYLDGVSIIYNLDGVDSLQLSATTIAKIFAGTITTWDDAAIASDNPGVSLPSSSITTVVRSDGSGTSANFTNYLVGVDPTDWTWEASTQFPTTSAVQSPQKGGSGVVSTVKATSGSIGYADHSAIGDASAAKIGVGSSYVEFSTDGVAQALADGGVVQDTGVDGDLTYKFDYSKFTSSDVYPIPLLSYAIVSTKFEDSTQAELTKAYLGYIASSEGQKIAAANAGCAALPDSVLEKVQSSLEKIG